MGLPVDCRMTLQRVIDLLISAPHMAGWHIIMMLKQVLLRMTCLGICEGVNGCSTAHDDQVHSNEPK